MSLKTVPQRLSDQWFPRTSEMLTFFRTTPEEARYCLNEDVTSAEVIGKWARHIGYDRVVSMVALVGEEIVADGTLRRHRAGARRHIGEIRVVVDIAYDNAMGSVIFELVESKEDDAIKVTEGLGFKKVATVCCQNKWYKLNGPRMSRQGGVFRARRDRR